MAEPAAFKYRAFISYSHADTSWAKWLHRGLESFRIDTDLVGRETATGTIPKMLRPIFRDREDFTAGHTLTDQTLAALDASHALIVICSPASAKSHYVNEEIRLFKSRHQDRPVIPLILAGTPDDPKDECFSLPLKFKVSPEGEITTEPEVPVAADVREEGDGKNLALAKVVAGLFGVSSDDIFRRAERERRRQARVRLAIGLGIISFAAAGIFLGWQQQRTIADVRAIVAKYDIHGPNAGSANASHTLVSMDFYDAGLSEAVTAIAEGAASDGRYAKALELLEAGKPAEAEPLLKAVAEEEKLRAAHESERAAAAYLNLGSITRISDPKRALEAYSEAIALDPNNAEALFWYARLQEAAGHFHLAKKGYEQLLALGKGGKCKNCDRGDFMVDAEIRLRDLPWGDDMPPNFWQTN
jgi:hypothetical protein